MQDEKVYKPLKQVAHATHAFESMHPKVVEGVNYFRNDDAYPTRLYVPVIITTANIYVPEFEPQDVVKGDVQPGKLSLGEPRKWASYEFPLPDFLGYHVE
ncbi:hypothetical protein FHX81_3624 [Saccharothrix saharensis]|uniref:Uncharacterized protein n=2 Tax=Saccharothrix saharensis TaxID=571190 RepID=A0A543JES4_9PSEU|nr:hypothetical protein FHX81_3624 [Saccharothrix saharensis]